MVRTVAAAREAGIASVSLDLLYDVPDATLADWIETLDAALALEPDHLSLYALTLDDPDAEGLTGPDGDHLPTTAGARRWRDAARPVQDEDRAAAQYHHAVHRLAEDGWRGYEISNWARPGHESRHNLVYWERRPYEAVGPGAHAFDGVTRRWNAARLDGYLAALTPAGGGPARAAAGRLGDARRGGRRRRDRDPRPADRPRRAAGRRPRAAPRRRLRLGARGRAARRHPDDRVVLTTRGRLLSNELFSRSSDRRTASVRSADGHRLESRRPRLDLQMDVQRTDRAEGQIDGQCVLVADWNAQFRARRSRHAALGFVRLRSVDTPPGLLRCRQPLALSPIEC